MSGLDVRECLVRKSSVTASLYELLSDTVPSSMRAARAVAPARRFASEFEDSSSSSISTMSLRAFEPATSSAARAAAAAADVSVAQSSSAASADSSIFSAARIMRFSSFFFSLAACARRLSSPSPTVFSGGWFKMYLWYFGGSSRAVSRPFHPQDRHLIPTSLPFFSGTYEYSGNLHDLHKTNLRKNDSKYWLRYSSVYSPEMDPRSRSGLSGVYQDLAPIFCESQLRIYSGFTLQSLATSSMLMKAVRIILPRPITCVTNCRVL
mmetsp:Transcript_13013/g.41062  ORF Transcript_13013/g.41062 Transcript_13013/m.41062 type:complete len:265 (+) Transcript_13013:389-1183(+)